MVASKPRAKGPRLFYLRLIVGIRGFSFSQIGLTFAGMIDLPIFPRPGSTPGSRTKESYHKEGGDGDGQGQI